MPRRCRSLDVSVTFGAKVMEDAGSRQKKNIAYIRDIPKLHRALVDGKNLANHLLSIKPCKKVEHSPYISISTAGFLPSTYRLVGAPTSRWSPICGSMDPIIAHMLVPDASFWIFDIFEACKHWRFSPFQRTAIWLQFQVYQTEFSYEKEQLSFIHPWCHCLWMLLLAFQDLPPWMN